VISSIYKNAEIGDLLRRRETQNSPACDITLLTGK
jgi:hypothetical protein